MIKDQEARRISSLYSRFEHSQTSWSILPECLKHTTLDQNFQKDGDESPSSREMKNYIYQNSKSQKAVIYVQLNGQILNNFPIP